MTEVSAVDPCDFANVSKADITEEIKTPRRFGWSPEFPDARDYQYSSLLADEPEVAAAKLQMLAPDMPERTLIPKLDKYMPHVDQLDIGSCVGCSTNYLFQYERKVVTRSILQIYYEARRRMGWQDADTGAFIRDGMMVLRQLGAGRHSYWEYDTSKFAVDPPQIVDRDALKRKLFDAYALSNGDEYRHCLADGHPFVIGFTVYSGFMSTRMDKYGIQPMPNFQREYVVGGHAVCVVGYDMDFRNSETAKRLIAAGFPAQLVPARVYIVRNSWGGEWGDGGDFYIDMDYLDNLDYADDAWTGRNFVAAQSGLVH